MQDRVAWWLKAAGYGLVAVVAVLLLQALEVGLRVTGIGEFFVLAISWVAIALLAVCLLVTAWSVVDWLRQPERGSKDQND